MTPQLSESEKKIKIQELREAALKIKLYAYAMSSPNPIKAAALLKLQTLIEPVIEAIEELG